MDKQGSNDILDNSAILQETRATYLPQEGERPEWEIEDTVQVMDDDDDEVCMYIDRYVRAICSTLPSCQAYPFSTSLVMDHTTGLW